MIITRKIILNYLEAWQRGEKTAQEIWEWAESHFAVDSTDYDDWENDNSVSKEVMGALDCLNMNLVIVEDIPTYIEFLKTPQGQFQEGYAKWQQQLDSIDYKQRQKTLKDDPLYQRFCNE